MHEQPENQIGLIGMGTSVIIGYDAPAAVIAAAHRLKPKMGNIIQIADGAGDDEEANTCVALGGMVILIGTKFNLSDHIYNFASNTWLRGSGKYKTILFVGNGIQKNAITVNAGQTGVIISDLSVDGNQDNNVETGPGADSIQNCIYLAGVTACTVMRVYCHDAIFHGVFINGGCSNTLITESDLSENRYRGAHMHTDCDSNIFAFNYLYKNADDGGLGATLGGLFVVFNGGDYNIVIGNRIIDDYCYGLDIEGGTTPCYGNVVANNTINCQTYAGVYGLYMGGNGLYNLVFTGNSIRVSSHGVVQSPGVINCDGLMFIGNNIYADATGFYIQSGGKGWLICNNAVRSDSENPFNLTGLTGGIVSINSARGNASYDGFKLTNVVRSVFIGNTLEDCDYVMREVSGCSKNIYSLNIYSNAIKDPPYYVNSTSIVFGNIDYIHPGEIRVKAVELTPGNANSFAFAWQNPELREIMVLELMVDETIAGGTAGSVLDAGVAPDATTHANDLINGADLNTVGIYLSTARKKIDAYGGANDYITGQILTQNAGNLAGYAYIKYMGVGS